MASQISKTKPKRAIPVAEFTARLERRRQETGITDLPRSEGTPEEIVLHPATDYVAEFTQAVPRAKVVRVASVMKPAEGAEPAATIAASAKVAEAAPMFLTHDALRVVDAQGETLGHLRRDDVVALMLGG